MAKPKRQPLMAGNWKMNLHHLEAIALVQKLAFTLSPEDYEAVEVVVLPPYTDLRSVQTLVDGDKLLIRYGAQDVSEHDNGAYTGDISAPMLVGLADWVIVGHSERRRDHGETDDRIGRKLARAVEAGLRPILCVGEQLNDRDAGRATSIVDAQLAGALAGPGGHREHRGDGIVHAGGIADRCQLTQPRAVTEPRQDLLGDLQCQTGLTHPAHTDQGHHSRLPQRGRGLLEFAGAADERAHLQWQIPHKRIQRPQRRKRARQVGVDELEDVHTAGQVAQAVLA